MMRTLAISRCPYDPATTAAGTSTLAIFTRVCDVNAGSGQLLHMPATSTMLLLPFVVRVSEQSRSGLIGSAPFGKEQIAEYEG